MSAPLKSPEPHLVQESQAGGQEAENPEQPPDRLGGLPHISSPEDPDSLNVGEIRGQEVGHGSPEGQEPEDDGGRFISSLRPRVPGAPPPLPFPQNRCMVCGERMFTFMEGSLKP